MSVAFPSVIWIFSDPKEGSSKEIDSSEDIFDHDCAFQDHTCSTLVDSSTQTQVDVSEAMTQTEEFEYLFQRIISAN